MIKKTKNHTYKLTFYDSLKIIPFSVEDIAKTYNLPISKLKIDYNKPRKKSPKITKEEQEYIKNDVMIVAKALKFNFDKGLDKMTQGSNALANFKKIITEKKFRKYFPILHEKIDEFIREGYKGGFTYLSPEYQEKITSKGVTLDVNSLYPFILYTKDMPIEQPIYFEGEYKEDKVYNLYIQRFSCIFELKPNKIPTLQIKNPLYSFKPTEYLTSSGNEKVTMTMTNSEYKLFREQYDVYDLDFIDGFKFKSINTLFRKYIDKWIDEKNKGTIEKNFGKRQLAKLMLNSLYGKFGMSKQMKSKIPFLGEDDIIHYKLSDTKPRKGLYIPVAVFTTAYARELTQRTAQSIMDYSIKKYGKNKYIYSDTDSVSCELDIEELKQFCDIDNIKLGCWKHENTFDKAKFIRQKCYLKNINGITEITCAGMPKECYKNVNFKNFKVRTCCSRKINL